jgi:hypothetical protein
MLRFVLRSQGQGSQVSTRCDGMPCRSPLRYRQAGPGLVSVKHVRELIPSTAGKKGFCPAHSNAVLTVGVR